MEIGDIVRLKGQLDCGAYILRGKIKRWMEDLQRLQWSGTYTTTASYQIYPGSGHTYQANATIYNTGVHPYYNNSYGTTQTISTSATYPSTYPNYGSVGDDVWMLDAIGDEPQYLLRSESELEVDVFLTEVHKLRGSMKAKDVEVVDEPKLIEA